MSQKGMVKWRGPNHRANCTGSVQARKTTSRGASKTRVMVSRGSFFTALAFIRFLLVLQLAKVFVEPIEALFPELAIVADPVRHFLERAGVETAGAPLRVASAGDQPGALEHFQVLRDRRQAHVERLGQL